MAQFASDAFTGTTGDLLTTYSANWTQHPNSATTAQIASGRVRVTAGGLASLYYHSGSPANADYSVLADIHELSDPTSADAGVVGRLSTSAATFYFARHAKFPSPATDAWQLFKCVAGTFTQLGSNVTDAIATGTSAQVMLRMQGTSIALYKRGEATATISVTDSAITAAGKAGLRIFGDSPSPTDTTLYHLDNFLAVDKPSFVPRRPNFTHMLVR